MSIFDEIVLTWNGKEYKIPPGQVMGAIARIEDVLTLKELGGYAQRNDVPLAKVSQAYGVVLRYAGAHVKDEEVYAALFDGNTQQAIIRSVETLLLMMIPPTRGDTQKKVRRRQRGGNR